MKSRSWMLRALALLGLGLPWLLPPTAQAYEDHATLALDVGYVYATDPTLPHNGLALGIEAGLGLDETWSLRALAGFGFHPGDPSRSVVGLGGELLYVFDILEFVPYLGVGADVLGSWQQPRHHHAPDFDFGVHPVVGVDWLITRDLALGLVARPAFLLTELRHEPLYLSVLLSASLLIDL